MKWNTKINIAQLSITTIGLVQLLNNAILMAILFVFAVYTLGAFENSGCVQ